LSLKIFFESQKIQFFIIKKTLKKLPFPMLAKSTAIFIFKDCCFLFVFGWFYLSVELTSDVRSLLRRLFFGNSKRGLKKIHVYFFLVFVVKVRFLIFGATTRWKIAPRRFGSAAEFSRARLMSASRRVEVRSTDTEICFEQISTFIGNK
jgi:hypothetical protein